MKPSAQINKVIELGVMMTDPIMKPFQQAVIALAQQQARIKVKAAAVAALTDSSGGIASVASPPKVVAGTLPVSTVSDGVALMAPKTGFDTAVAAIYAGQEELAAKITAIKAVIDPTRSLTVFAGTNDGTIAAVTTALTGNATTGMVAAASALTQLKRLRQNFSVLTSAINYLRVAVGLAPIEDGTAESIDTSGANWVGVATAATATAVTTGGASLPEVATETFLTAMTANLATLAVAVNQVRAIDDANVGPFVVATDRQRTKFRSADVTP